MKQSWEGEGKSLIAEPNNALWLSVTVLNKAGFTSCRLFFSHRHLRDSFYVLCICKQRGLQMCSGEYWCWLCLQPHAINFSWVCLPSCKVGWMVPSLTTSFHWWWWSCVCPNDLRKCFGNLSSLCTNSLVKCTVTAEEDKTWSLGLKEFSSCIKSEK